MKLDEYQGLNDLNGLKGRHNLAQGKRRRSVALGWKAGRIIVCAITIKKEQFLFRTERRISNIRQLMLLNSVRNKFSLLKIMFARTGSFLFHLSRATFRFVPHETLPWAELYWPFRLEK